MGPLSASCSFAPVGLSYHVAFVDGKINAIRCMTDGSSRWYVHVATINDAQNHVNGFSEGRPGWI